jgi:hypothetical protein
VRDVAVDFAPLVARDLGGVLPWLALFGGVMLWWRTPLLLAGGVVLGLLPVLFAAAYPVESEATRYYLPAFFVLAAAAGYGVAVLDAGMHGIARYAALGVVGLAWAILLGNDISASSQLFAQPAQHDGRDFITRITATTPLHSIIVAPWNYATTLAYGAYVLHGLDDRIVLTAGPHEFEPSYRRWMPKHPIVVISDDPETFAGFRVRELDDGSPHLYALR